MCRLCVLIATTDPSVSPSPGNPFRFSLSSWKIDPVCFPVANWSKCLTHVFPEPGKIGLKSILISHLIYLFVCLFVLLIEGWMNISIHWWLNPKSCLNQTSSSLFFHFEKGKILIKSNLLKSKSYSILLEIKKYNYRFWNSIRKKNVTSKKALVLSCLV